MPYFEIRTIQKKHKEANHDLFNSPISSWFFSFFYQARANEENHRAQSMGENFQTVLDLPLLPQGLSEGCGPPHREYQWGVGGVQDGQCAMC